MNLLLKKLRQGKKMFCRSMKKNFLGTGKYLGGGFRASGHLATQQCEAGHIEKASKRLTFCLETLLPLRRSRAISRRAKS